MSVTTTAVFNQDKFGPLLPAGTRYGWTGGPFEVAGEKTITATCTDGELQAAITAAVAVFVDYDANRSQIVSAAKNAVVSNNTYLAIGSPTNAQVVAQVRALTQQLNRVIRLVVGDFTGTT